jgi:hypothetical protein
MCDQVKVLDVKNRNAQFIERAPIKILQEVADIATGFIEVLTD